MDARMGGLAGIHAVLVKLADDTEPVLEALIRRIRQAEEERRVSQRACPVVLTSEEESVVVSLGARWQDTGRTGRVGMIPFYNKPEHSLYWGGDRIKRLAGNAKLQELVLEAFQEENWACRIDDPVPPKRGLEAAARLRETVRSLNRGMKPGTIRFFSDGSGKGICWKAVAECPNA